MKVKIKKLHEDAIIPQYAKYGDAGVDLTATDMWFEKGNVCYGTGLSIEIPHGYVGLLFPRSSNAKKDLLLCNAVGVIDSGYRGEIIAKFKITEKDGFRIYNINDRVCQLIILPYPKIEFIETDELSETSRGEGGFGSTGL